MFVYVLNPKFILHAAVIAVYRKSGATLKYNRASSNEIWISEKGETNTEPKKSSAKVRTKNVQRKLCVMNNVQSENSDRNSEQRERKKGMESASAYICVLIFNSTHTLFSFFLSFALDRHILNISY